MSTKQTRLLFSIIWLCVRAKTSACTLLFKMHLTAPVRALTSSIVFGMRKDGPRRFWTCGAALLSIALVVLLARSAHTHTSFYASCLTSVLERKTVVRSACSHAAQSFNIRPIWRDSSNTSLLVCQSTDRCCPQSPTFQSTSIFQLLRCPSSSIHHRGSLTLRGWYGCIDLTKTHADRSSLFWVTRCLVCTVNETKCIINASHQSSDVEVPCCSRNTLNLVTPTKIYPVQQHETKVIHSAKIAHVDCSSPN